MPKKLGGKHPIALIIGHDDYGRLELRFPKKDKDGKDGWSKLYTYFRVYPKDFEAIKRLIRYGKKGMLFRKLQSHSRKDMVTA